MPRPTLAHWAAALSLIGTAAAAPATRPARLVARRPATRPVTLHVGDAAPPVRVAEWLKGTPSTSLTDGRVHVVEFWATWCGWCVEDMPHLSALARQVRRAGADHVGERVGGVARRAGGRRGTTGPTRGCRRRPGPRRSSAGPAT